MKRKEVFIKAVALGFFCIGAPQAVHAQYKCVHSDGAVTFQQVPCPTGNRSERIVIKSAPSSPDGERPIEIRAGIAAQRPVVGMTLKELQRAMGTPDKVNAGQYGTNTSNQLIYYRGDRTLYVYTENGIVRSIQNMEGGKIEISQPTATRTKACPSAREIRDIEIEINKIQNRDNHQLQAELRKQYGEAKQCGR